MHRTVSGQVPLARPDACWGQGSLETDWTDRSRARNRSGSASVVGPHPRVRVLGSPNGIGLSPDVRTLYVAETDRCRLLAWDVVGPGKLELSDYRPWHGRLHAMRCDGSMFDSLAVDSAGNIAVATIGAGGISVFDTEGALVDFVETGDPLTTNICFGGDDLRDAFITCSGTGRLLHLKWPQPGLARAFTA